MTALALRPQSGAISNEGCVRATNEDSYLARDEAGLWAVADGMGGHEHGDWASATLIGELERPLPEMEFEEACGAVAERIHRANRIIFEEGEARRSRMGSTVVALRVQGGKFATFWVGDSRSYLLRDGRLHRLSRDHSQVQEMIDRGLLTPAEAADHPMSHVLARAVGVACEVEVDVIQDEVEPGDTFLLCSDGLHGCLTDEEIAALLGRHPVEEAARSLFEAAVGRGAPDNVTVVAIRFTEPTVLAFGPEGAR